jgi:hypothetical protein
VRVGRVTGQRGRWIAVGGAVATVTAGGLGLAGASGGAATVFVPITPCRLVDTRPAPTTVGTRAAPLGPGEIATFQVHGSNGNCTIPTSAAAVTANVTIVAPTSDSFLSVFPADAARPNASNLNWRAGQAPTPNAVTVALSTAGAVSVFNERGDVDVIVDLVGYHQPGGSGAQGPQGPAGPHGPPGAPGPPGAAAPQPAWVRTVGPVGADFTSVSAALASITDASATKRYEIRIAPGVYTEPAGITLKNHVDLVGSGAAFTTITSPGVAPFGGTVNAVGDVTATIRHLTIASTGADIPNDGSFPNPIPLAVGVRIETSGGHVRLSDVEVTADMTGGNVVRGIWVATTTPSVQVTVERAIVRAGAVDPGGPFGELSVAVWVDNGTVTVRSADLEATSVVVASYSSTPTRVLASTLRSPPFTLANNGTVELAGVLVSGGSIDPGARCGGVVADGVALDETCS